MDKGDVAYYVKQFENGVKYVHFGIVLEWSDYHEPVLQLLEAKDLTTINGIPKKDFVTPTRWQKLPKGWSYNTKLYDLRTSSPDELGELMVDCPDDIRDAYARGLLVSPDENDHGEFEAEISKEGWRIVKRYGYPHETYVPSRISLPRNKIFATYEEAKAEIDKFEAELKRQSELSDYEWSVEQIDGVLSRWKYQCGKTHDEVLKARKRLLGFDRVEELEVRIIMGNIQWKYWKNKKWNTLFDEA